MKKFNLRLIIAILFGLIGIAFTMFAFFNDYIDLSIFSLSAISIFSIAVLFAQDEKANQEVDT
jgi:hypothetical protein